MLYISPSSPSPSILNIHFIEQWKQCSFPGWHLFPCLNQQPFVSLHCEVTFQLVSLHVAALVTSFFRFKLLLWSLLNCRESSIALVRILLLLLSVLSETFLNPPGGTGLQVLNTSIVFILPSAIHLIDSVRPHMIRHAATPLLLCCFLSI